jgi:peptide/nickel transport system ATP-binding protein
MATPVLEIDNLRIEFPTRRGCLVAVDGVSFHIGPGEVLGVVGESGAGKSLTAGAVIGLLDPPGRIAGGQIRLGGTRIDDWPEARLRRAHRHHLPGSADQPQSALHHRPPAYRNH